MKNQHQVVSNHPEFILESCRLPKGFTLIEILIVVLIVAVLSAVALPEYRRAALKSRVIGMFPVGKSLADSNEEYYLSMGEYAERLDELNIENKDDKLKAKLENSEQYQYIKLTQDNLNNRLIWYQKHSPNFAGEIHCEAKSDDVNAVWLCSQGLGGKPIFSKMLYKTWALEGNGDGIPQMVTYNNNPAGVSLELEDGDKCIGGPEEAGSYTSCRSVHASNGAICEGNVYGSCAGINKNNPSLFDNYSQCIGNNTYACIRSTFSNNSTCEGNFWNASCSNSTYESRSVCVGTAGGTKKPNADISNACGGSTFEGESRCEGNISGQCSGNTFKNGSYCEANAAGTCVTDVSKYDATSYCKGKYCPVGAPKQGGGEWKACEEGQDGYGEEGRTC